VESESRYSVAVTLSHISKKLFIVLNHKEITQYAASMHQKLLANRISWAPGISLAVNLLQLSQSNVMDIIIMLSAQYLNFHVVKIYHFLDIFTAVFCLIYTLFWTI